MSLPTGRESRPDDSQLLPSILGRKHLQVPLSFTKRISSKQPNMCFGSSNKDPQWWGYLDDGKGWTARPKSEYMTSPDYNRDLRRQLRQEKKDAAAARLATVREQNKARAGMPAGLSAQPPQYTEK